MYVCIYTNTYSHTYHTNVKMRIFVALLISGTTYHIGMVSFLKDRVYHRVGFKLNSDSVS